MRQVFVFILVSYFASDNMVHCLKCATNTYYEFHLGGVNVAKLVLAEWKKNPLISLINDHIEEMDAHIEPCKTGSLDECARFVTEFKDPKCSEEDDVCHKLEVNATMHSIIDVPGTGTDSCRSKAQEMLKPLSNVTNMRVNLTLYGLLYRH